MKFSSSSTWCTSAPGIRVGKRFLKRGPEKTHLRTRLNRSLVKAGLCRVGGDGQPVREVLRFADELNVRFCSWRGSAESGGSSVHFGLVTMSASFGCPS
mmetsp:Transcript_17795/g.42791  ORF Transcript_17795/g.42791 Transcript_17795/m.42791 type:complete len:99 (-) Transcript_17795:499-795(-)